MAALDNPFPTAQQSSHMAGGALTMRMIQGMEAAVQSNSAAASEIRRNAKEVAIAGDMYSRMSAKMDTAISQQLEIMQNLAGLATRSESDALVQSVTGHTPGAALGSPENPLNLTATPSGPEPASPSTPPPPPAPPAQATYEGPETPERPGLETPDRPGSGPGVTQGVEAPAPAQSSNWDRLQQGRGYSLSQLRGDTGRWIGEKVSSAQIGPTMRQKEGLRSWETFNPETGEAIADATSGQMRNMRISNRVRAVGGSVAESGMAKGLMNAVPAAVGAGAAVVAGGLVVADQATKFAERERERNAQYQRVSGDTNVSAYGERMEQSLFSLSQRGTMSGDQSKRLYEGIAATGLRGEERTGALDMAMENWREFGMEINDSIDLIRISAKNGITGLTGVSEALTQVTDAAREAGENADVARDVFTQSYDVAAGTLFDGGGAEELAAGSTAAVIGAGFKPEQIDATGWGTTQDMQRLAHENQMELGPAIDAWSGQEGQLEQLEMKTEQIQRYATQMIEPAGLEYIRQYREDNGVSGDLDKPQALEIAREMFGQKWASPQQIEATMQSRTGIRASSANEALALLVMSLDGGFAPAANLQDELAAREAAKITDFEDHKVSEGDGITTAGDLIKSMGLETGDTVGELHDPSKSGALAWNPETERMDHVEVGEGDKTFTGHASAQEYYNRVVKEQDLEYSPIISQAVKDDSGSDTKVRINTGTEGDDRWESMLLSDAIKYHPDQVAHGDVQVTEGEKKGQTLATATGQDFDDSFDVELTGDGRGEGEDMPDAEPVGSATMRASIMVHPSSDLRRWFDFRGAGVSTGAPGSMQAPNESLATGDG